MLNSLLVILAAGLAGGLMLWPRIAQSKGWKATITPLASIIGSGFLVLGPVLLDHFGPYAPAVMAGLCLLAYGFGASIRANIRRLDAGAPVQERAETISAWILAFAYIISVAYYLNLFGAFAVSLFPALSDLAARLVTSGIYFVILLTGLRGGFHALERLEQVSVGVKLAIIAGLLAALGGDVVQGGAIASHPIPKMSGWGAIALSLGLLVTVQGFETSRYLGGEYPAELRIRSMRWAQGLSSLIYIAYIGLIVALFSADDFPFSETAVIDMMARVAPILPPLLVIAALSAQFSAAVADTGGAGGLFSELTRGRIGVRHGYVLLVGAGLALTWALNVFEIIAWASRAFAAYYAVQAGIAGRYACAGGKRAQGAGAFALMAVGLVAAVFGVAVDA